MNGLLLRLEVQGSILGPLLFNFFLADLFFLHGDIGIANFADDNTSYSSAKNIDDVIQSLEQALVPLLKMVRMKHFKR